MSRETGRGGVRAGWIEAALIVLVALALIVPALRLHAHGLWADELFTAYFSDPAPGWGAALLRAAEDIHPPTYAMIVRLLRQITGGDATTVARGFALVCSVASLAVLATALRQRMRWPAILFTLAAAAQSGPFLSVVTEARSYALAALIVTIDIALILPMLREGAASRTRVPLALLLIFGGLVHSYLVLLGVALALYLALIAAGWRGRAGWLAVAAAVAVTAQAVARWQAPHIVVDVKDVWFSAAPLAQASHIVRGTMLATLSPLGIAALLLALITVPWRQLREGLAAPRTLIVTPAAFALFAIAVTTLGAVAYSSLFTPVLSRRLFLVLAPFFWLLAAELFRVALDRWGRPLMMVLLAVAIVGGLRVLDAGQQAIEPWRDTAVALRGIPGCQDAPILVTGLERPAVRASEAAIFYGYYDPGTTRLELVSRKAPAAEIVDRALALHGAGPCPVLLWSVHHLRRARVFEIAELLRRDPRLPKRSDVRVDAFASARPVGLLPHFARADAKPSGFFVRLVPATR